MNRYIGTKIINATAMNRADYNIYRGWSLHANEDGADEGYLVEYPDGGKPNDARHAGYISWIPKEQFDNAYRQTSGITFGAAVEALKIGKKVSRTGWNGNGMWLELQRPDARSKMTLPYIYLNYPGNAQNTPGARVPWLASQTDALADDWRVVD